MPHMVIFRSAEGKPGYHQTESLDEAIRFVEHLRNKENVPDARVFQLKEVMLEVKTYVKVEVAGAEAPAEAAPAAAAQPEPAPVPAAAAAAPAPAPAPAPSASASACPSSGRATSTGPGRRTGHLAAGCRSGRSRRGACRGPVRPHDSAVRSLQPRLRFVGQAPNGRQPLRADRVGSVGLS